MGGNRGGQSHEIHYNFFAFSLYCCTLDYMWNIKSFNYLNYSYICKQGSSLKPKENASVSVAKLVVKMHII